MQGDTAAGGQGMLPGAAGCYTEVRGQPRLEKRPENLAPGAEAAPLASSERQVHCCATGTRAMTWSTCWPQPAQVVLSHVEQ